MKPSMALHEFQLPSLIPRLLLVLSLLLDFSNALKSVDPLGNPHKYTSHYQRFTHYKTHPNFQPEEFHIRRFPKNTSVLAPGYIFMDPIFHNKGFGPQIYDIWGNLIWHGQHTNRSQNLHVCDFKGEKGTHLCTSIRAGAHPFPKGTIKLPPGMKELPATWPKNMVLDNTYNVVDWFQYGHKGLPMNVHAFEMWDDGHGFGTIVPQPHWEDLRPYGGKKGGWVRNQCVDDIDVHTKKSRFHWCYLEGGLKLWETQVFPDTKGATNTTFTKAGDGSLMRNWDFLHMNAVAKSVDGDYFMSIRYLDQIVKVAGPNNTKAEPGSILWRLGGTGNNFTYIDFPYKKPFSRNHDVRSISTDPDNDEEVISVFNNAWEGATRPSQPYSSGIYIRLNSRDWTAKLEYEYIHPKLGPRIAGGRGSVQRLPNRNVMVGWGKLPHMSEFNEAGEVLWHNRFKPKKSINPHFSYRAFKSPWVGKPKWKPKMVVYSKTCQSSTITCYVSWNGATEVVSWRFFLGKDAEGPWLLAGTFPKKGFETTATLHSTTVWGFMPYVRVQALDVDENVLSSNEHRTFVPPRSDSSRCNKHGCDDSYRYRDDLNIAGTCSDPKIWPYLAIIFLVLFIESSVILSDQASHATLTAVEGYSALTDGEPIHEPFFEGSDSTELADFEKAEYRSS